MKFGLFSHVPWPEGVEPGQVYEHTVEQAQYGAELGFHSIWLAEHHFSRYGLGSSSLMLISHIAARTRTIRLGTAVLVPTLHNPLRLAEDTATLDVLSGGRLDVGYGRGALDTNTTVTVSIDSRVKPGFRRPSPWCKACGPPQNIPMWASSLLQTMPI